MFRFHFSIHVFFWDQNIQKGRPGGFPTAPRLALAKTVPSSSQGYPGSCRNRAIPAKSGNSGGLLQKSDEAIGHKTRSSSGSRRGLPGCRPIGSFDRGLIAVFTSHEKNDQRGGGRQMNQEMRSIWDDSIARRQEGMRFAEHDLIASSSLRFRSERIRYPPGADLPDEEQAIANHEPVVKPVGIGSSKVQQAKA